MLRVREGVSWLARPEISMGVVVVIIYYFWR